MTLPKPGPLLGVVEFLAKTCYKVDPEKECDRFDLLYRRALDEWFPNPFPFGDGNGPDDDDPFSGPGGSSEAPEPVWSRRRGRCPRPSSRHGIAPRCRFFRPPPVAA